MKRFFVFTLTSLFAITCLLLTNLPASYEETHQGDYHDDTFNGAWAGAIIGVWYEHPWAVCSPYGFIWNNSPGSIRYYYNAESKLLRSGGGSATRHDKEDGNLPMGDWFVRGIDLNFNMNGRVAGRYTLSGECKVKLKDMGHVKADASTDFEYNE